MVPGRHRGAGRAVSRGPASESPQGAPMNTAELLADVHSRIQEAVHGLVDRLLDTAVDVGEQFGAVH